jgi:hypothetical protein
MIIRDPLESDLIALSLSVNVNEYEMSYTPISTRINKHQSQFVKFFDYHNSARDKQEDVKFK